MPLIYGQSMLYMYDGASVNGRKKIHFFFSTVFPKKNSTVFQKQKNFFLNILRLFLCKLIICLPLALSREHSLFEFNGMW